MTIAKDSTLITFKSKCVLFSESSITIVYARSILIVMNTIIS